MNDSSWGAPPRAGSQAGYWGPNDHGAVPHGPVQGAAAAGPAYDAPEAQQTRPMPIVPDVPAHGGNQDDDRGAARLGGPLFRDETFRDGTSHSGTFRDETSPLGTFRDETPSALPPAAVPQNPEPMP
ncbi:hypothetical protein ACFT0E_31940, partial [Streptomyces sp. NPDC057052]